MSSLSDLFYFSILVSTLLLSVLGLWFTAAIPGIDRWSKRFFLSYFIVFLLCFSFGFLEAVFTIIPVSVPVFYFILIMESLFLSVPLPMLTAYLVHCSGERLRSSRLFRTVLLLWAVCMVELVCSPFTGGFTYVTPDRDYFRGPLYPLLLLPMIAVLLINLAAVIKRRKRLTLKTFLGFITAIVPMTIALFVQLFIDVFTLIDISVILSALSMYSFILSDQIEQSRKHQQEIADQRASIMVLQMRPHFIYNTMTSIYCLCDQDPQLARQVVMDFTNYLRKNFTAIASSTPIPFSSELEHTRAYLAVEQALYEDSLFVDYDTPHTRFRVPPLTLQPIVENAVKHGRDPYAGTFHISIRTRKTDSGTELVVADNGRGFEAADDNGLHLALENIQERLEIMCRGNLLITPNEGGGTVVTITIPDTPAN